MHGRLARPLALSVLATGLASFACAPAPGPAHAGLGELSLALTLPGGATINTVTYILSGYSFAVAGTIDVSDPQTTVATAFVSDVPEGGYTVIMSATASDGASCSGTTQVTVVADQTAIANVILRCTRTPTTGQVAIKAGVDSCPFITGLSASALQAEAGSDINVAVAATDLDGNTLSYAWSTTPGPPFIGAVVPANAPLAVFHCAAVGTTQLSVAVSDGVCGDQRVNAIPITCLAQATAPPMLEVDAYCGSSTTQDIDLTMRIINPSNRDINWDDIKVRYYYSGDGTIPVVDFDSLQNPTWNQMKSLIITNTTATYMELAFQPFGAGTLSAFDLTAGSGLMQLRIHAQDMHDWDVSQLDDYSFSDGLHPCTGVGNNTFQPRTTITGYVRGQLAWGTEPPSQ
jgi:hypothetical protein